MKKTALIITLIILILILFRSLINVSVNTSQNETPASLETKINKEGSVEVSVIPKSLDGNIWSFEVGLNTHSGSIQQDLMAVSELIDNNGNSYKPIGWEGSPPGGHHRDGILKFKAISPKPKTIEIKIKDVGDISERSFKWTL